MELWDEAKEEFVYLKEFPIQLEHSLLSISKWEAKWKKPFLSKDEKTSEEITDYVRCMTTTPNVPDDVYRRLSSENVAQIEAYIEDSQTATTFTKEPGGGRSIVTSEIIYYWMVSFGIPFECQKWHLNRLLALIQVCERKNRPAKKQSQRSIMEQNAALNAQRRKKLGSKG